MLRIAQPVFRFPPPSGPHAIGTLTYHWVDNSRSDLFTADPSARRDLMVQVWYPADIGPPPARARYMQEADAVMAAFARSHGKPGFHFSLLKTVTTNAVTVAPVAAGLPSYPILSLPEEATGFRQMNTFQEEELVSHGYIVAALDQPGAAADVVFPDGHTRVGVPGRQLQALLRLLKEVVAGDLLKSDPSLILKAIALVKAPVRALAMAIWQP